MSNLDNTAFIEAERERLRRERQEKPVAAQRKTKIVFEQLQPVTNHYRYKVVSLSNRTKPVIGTELKQEEVDQLIKDSENLTVEIKPASDKRKR